MKKKVVSFKGNEVCERKLEKELNVFDKDMCLKKENL